MSQRPPSALPVERVRGERPENPDWRADGVARSHHSRLLDHLVEPLDDHDPARAEEICGKICRAALVDLAPALSLLPAGERRRARVLGAFVLTLYDFAAQPGLDGDRLAELNRWEFRLEEALDGRPAGQPIFVLMAREEADRPWSREALDRILAAARRRALAAARPTATSGGASGLAEGLAAALLGEPASEDAMRLAGGLLGDGAIGTEPVGGVPRRWRAAVRYLQLVGRRRAGAKGPLGLGARLVLMARAQFLP